MKITLKLFKRNIKMFFSDKGILLTSLITPAILLFIYVAFLNNVFKQSFGSIILDGFGVNVSEKVINGFVGGQLISSLLAVTAVTVSVCSNMLMVQDKITGARADMLVTPVKKYIPPVSYYIATLAVSFFVSLVALSCGLVYIASVGWYLSVTDVLLVIMDTFLLVMFGTALSSIINFFLTSQGQISAVGSAISSCYGFLCGAYMQTSMFPEWLQRAITFFPGIYGTSLLREHLMRGAISQMAEEGLPAEAISTLKDTVDCNIYFFDTRVEVWQAYLVVAGAALLLLGSYVLLNVIRNKRTKTA